MWRVGHVLGAAVGLVLLGSIAACGDTGDAGEPSSVSPAEADAEYAAEESALQLAPGWHWPRDVRFLAQTADGSPVIYQAGFGTTQADRYWYCSWQSRYVTSGLSPAAYQEAAAALRKVRATHMYQVDIIPVDRPVFDQELDEALAGRRSLMARDVRLNCEKGVNTLAPQAAPVTPTPG